MTEKTLSIPGFTIETEKASETKRVATYIRNTVNYKRRRDLEQENGHLIILDVGTTRPLRIINLYMQALKQRHWGYPYMCTI